MLTKRLSLFTLAVVKGRKEKPNGGIIGNQFNWPYRKPQMVLLKGIFHCQRNDVMMYQVQ